ncbi:MAG: GNAT family N-acetyltransferase [Phycisphaerae bacterium]|jgi:RimJ/RimL family protein N-acetyltransferase
MDDYRVDFDSIAWVSPAPGVRFKAFEAGRRKLRMLEFTRASVEADWCLKGHYGYLLEGRLEVDFGGTKVEFGPGDGVLLPAGWKHRHKARALTDAARLILVEDVAAPGSGAIPTLRTPRLVLRPFTLADAPTVQRLAGAREISDTMLSIPHPYEDGVAEGWIAGHQAAFDAKRELTLAITLAGGGQLVGSIGLMGFGADHKRGELGYWVGKEYWGNGYCSEAAREVVRYGFVQLGLGRVFAHHLTRNPASGRVMQKIGMKHEGTLRQHVVIRNRFEDLECYGILREEFRV